MLKMRTHGHHHHHHHNDHAHHHHHDDHHHDHEGDAHAAPGAGHNHRDMQHLHSHPHGEAQHLNREELRDLAASFIEAFRTSEDKTSYLRLAGIPFQICDSDGRAMHLVDTRIETSWQIGTATPGFATKELAYLPYPGKMVSARETMSFTYVSLTERRDLDLCDLLSVRFARTS
jgi:hypothetical protein